MFIVCVNVLFLSNSQHAPMLRQRSTGVYRMCQCPLFKQFTTNFVLVVMVVMVFIVCVNVLFLSNSQRIGEETIVSRGVYRMCQCPLFKQFTTEEELRMLANEVFIVCVNVLFLSNSQPIV